MKFKNTLLITALAATTLLPLTTLAQAQDSKGQGYLLDTRGEVVKNSTGLCWHTNDWTPARAIEGCDPVNKPVAMVMPAPKAVEAPPMAPPVVMAAAPVVVAPMQRKISFSGDALFAFDKSELKPEGKTMLDDLVRQTSGATYDTIVVTGHTDRFGSNKYNQKLSEQRANVVKAYLVNANIQANRIDAQGKGETQPTTQTGDCRGGPTPKVIACLQPDRRVDVEMTGSKTVAGS